jgi:accessory gene regulator B
VQILINAVAGRMALRIKDANPDHPASLEVLKYAIAAIINLVGTIVVAVAAASFLGHLAGTITALISFALLRMISGGYHLGSSMYCLLITAAAANLIPYLTLSAPVILLLTAVSFILAAFFAPTNLEKSSRIPKKFYPALKYAALLLIAINFFYLSSVVAVCFFFQGLTLVPIRR